jgi:hypothetical protein
MEVYEWENYFLNSNIERDFSSPVTPLHLLLPELRRGGMGGYGIGLGLDS